MICPRCNSERVNVQMVSEVRLRKHTHGLLWWLFIGWWWLPLKWLCFTIPALIVKLFAPKRYETTVSHKSVFVCQNCGYHWQV